jgi:hypothetical protein
VPFVPGATEAGASGGLSVLVSVLKARLLRLGALARARYYREMPRRFPRSYYLPGFEVVPLVASQPWR